MTFGNPASAATTATFGEPGEYDPITIGSGDLLSVTLSLDTAGYAGLWADWWVLAYHADTGTWYQYVAQYMPHTWRVWTGGTSIQAPLADVS